MGKKHQYEAYKEQHRILNDIQILIVKYYPNIQTCSCMNSIKATSMCKSGLIHSFHICV